MTRTMLNVTLAMLLGAAGCEQGGDDEPAEAETAETEAEAEAPEEGTEDEAAEDEPAEDEAETEEAEGAEAPEAPSEPGQKVGFSELVDGFAASKDEWLGKKVTLTGRYMNANSANGKLQNIALVQSEEQTKPTVLCTFAEAPDSVDHLTQYDEVTVQGTVDEFFDRAALSECSIVE